MNTALLNRLVAMSPSKRLTFASANSPIGYMDSVLHFESIRDCTVYICTTTKAEDTHALALLYAMLCKKPIIIDEIPDYRISPTLKFIITSRIRKFTLANLELFDDADLLEALQNITASTYTNYVLTKKEQVIIKSALRQYFRSLLATNH